MNGPQELAELVAQFLSDHIEAELDRIALERGQVTVDPFKGEEWALDAKPAFIAATDIASQDVSLDSWPFVVVSTARMSGQRRVDVLGDASVVYRRTYPIRFYIWARGDGYHYTAAVRARLLVGVGECVLRHPTFGTTTVRVNENDWTEDYSGVGDDVDLGTVAAGYIETSIDVDETLAPPHPVKGTANTIRLDTQALPAHPAFQ